MPAWQRLGEFPLPGLLDFVAPPAARARVAGAGASALVVGDGVLEVRFAGGAGAARERALAVADLDQVAEQVGGASCRERV